MPMILREVLPGLADELEALLRRDDELELVSQIASLKVVDDVAVTVIPARQFITLQRLKGLGAQRIETSCLTSPKE